MSSPGKSFINSPLFQKLHQSAQRINEHVHNGIQDARNNTRDMKSNAAAFVEEKALETKYVDIQIQFIGARGLPAMDLHTGASDPYFRAKLGHLSFVSSVKVETLNPVWNEPWHVMNVPSHATLSIEVFDKDDGAVIDDYIGKFETSISQGAKEIEIVGPPLSARSRGTFWLKIDSKPSVNPDPARHPYIFDGPIRFTRHFSPTVGLLTNLNDARLYSTWKMTLRAVPLFFGDKYQHWNEKYPAAQRIFQDRGGFAVRSGIIAGHKLLYARSTTNGFGTLTDPTKDTIRLLRSGSDGRQNGTSGGPFAGRIKPAVYTYVIAADDDTFRFSETGAAFFVDFASKHALHSACNERVRYSGEFHPRPKGGWQNFSDETPDSEVPWELVIDNNSGTYAPDKTMLPVLEGCLRYNFPGFTIVALDREDPNLIESREACRAYAMHRRGVSPDDLQPHKHAEDETSLAKHAMNSAEGQASVPTAA